MTHYANCESMSVYRISKGNDAGELVDSVEAIEDFARQHGPGKYHVDEISSDPLASGHTARKWGTVIVAPDGTVIIDQDQWPDS
jgi:hypothetical protein